MLAGELITRNFNIYIKYCFRESEIMEKNDFLLDLLHELAYRSDEGYPILSKQSHIYLISEILDEWGYTHIKNELIQNLTEASEEKHYSSPALNKTVKYKDRDGKDKEGLVGSLLRLAKDQPGREAAERALPADGTPEREKINNELGGEGQPNRNIEKEKEDKADVEAGKAGEAPAEAEPPQPAVFAGQGGDSYRAGLSPNDPAYQPTKDTAEKEMASPKREIAGKDKTLTKINSIESEEFNKSIQPSDEEFDIKNKKIANPIPPQPYKLPASLIENPKFPKKYLTALERMMNTKPTGDGTKWTHYSDLPGGQGQISAQAGDEFNEFTDSLSTHEAELIKNNPKLKTEGSRIITKSWIQSARNNRQAILNRITKEYPNSKIVATAWDTKDDVESLGLSDYGKNKGFSTDMYIKIKTENGDEILDEVSLKKSTEVNFLNSGAGKFMEWDSDLPDNINQNVYKENQRARLSETGTNLKSEIEKLLASGSDESVKLKTIFDEKGTTFADALNDLIKGKGSRAKSKVILASIKTLADGGNDIAKQYIMENDKIHKEFQSNAIKAITENPKMKEGMLNEIRSEFPLKAVSDGEESMAIGSNSLDKAIMKNIFGTSDYDMIKEKLSAETGPPPFLGYQAEVGGKIIPLAEIKVREDGVGYGGQIKFEMTLDKRFAKVLKTANDEVYKS
jgi:hypothetical protein